MDNDETFLPMDVFLSFGSDEELLEKEKTIIDNSFSTKFVATVTTKPPTVYYSKSWNSVGWNSTDPIMDVKYAMELIKKPKAEPADDESSTWD